MTANHDDRGGSTFTIRGDGAGAPADQTRLARRSIEVIRESQDAGGAYLASPTFPSYRFSWFRDGAFVADAMSRAGEVASAEAFFGWCAETIGARAGRIEELVRRHRAGEEVAPEEHLHCRYRADGREADPQWATFQLDGYGAWLWALGAHAARHRRGVEPFLAAGQACVRYVAEFWNEPCFDWWEERLGRHTTTLAALHAGLSAALAWDGLDADARAEAGRARAGIERAVATAATSRGRLAAELGGERLDASLVACATPFRLFAPDGPRALGTVRALEGELAHGGVHRYADDSFYGGGEWLVLAGLLGWWYAEVGRTDDAWAQLEWIAAQAAPGGELPEQVAGHLLVPRAYGEWVDRWGPPAIPLLWSHAMFLTLAFELGAVPNETSARRARVAADSKWGRTP